MHSSLRRRPLTADDIYATSLLISLPPDWTSCISHLLQSDSTTSSVIVCALKQESTRRKSKLINSSEDATASRSNISKDNKSPDQSFCSFCNKDGHDLDTCQTASRILKEAKEAYASKKKGEREANSKKRQKPKRKPAKAGKTEHAILGSDSDSNDDAAAATSARISASAAQRPSDTSILGLIDSGCSKSMTPNSNMLSEATP